MQKLKLCQDIFSHLPPFLCEFLKMWKILNAKYLRKNCRVTLCVMVPVYNIFYENLHIFHALPNYKVREAVPVICLIRSNLFAFDKSRALCAAFNAFNYGKLHLPADFGLADQYDNPY